MLPEVAAIRRNLTEEKMDETEPVTEYATTTFSPVTYARLADGRLLVYCHRDALATTRVFAVPLEWLP